MLESFISLFIKPHSDVYTSSYPQQTVVDNVVYTTPALQGMQRNHISSEEIKEMIRQHPGELEIMQNNILLILENYKENEKKLIGVVRFLK